MDYLSVEKEISDRAKDSLSDQGFQDKLSQL
jgi:hypothetical protein